MKLKLNIDELTDDFFEDTRLLGITATTKSYRFCWTINNMVGFNFRLNPEIEIHLQKKGRQYFFPVYQFTVANTDLSHYIYHNQYDGEYLLPEFKHMDFLWLVKGDCFPDEDCQNLIQSVKKINGVQLIAELTNEHIKNKGNLVF
ncbi:MAG: IPExxxVDY family protein [Panacibacter sp.]